MSLCAQCGAPDADHRVAVSDTGARVVYCHSDGPVEAPTPAEIAVARIHEIRQQLQPKEGQ